MSAQCERRHPRGFTFGTRRQTQEIELSDTNTTEDQVSTGNRLRITDTLYLVPVNEYAKGTLESVTPPVETAQHFEFADECWDIYGTPIIPGDLARAIAATQESRNAFRRVTQWHRDIGEESGRRDVQDAIKKAFDL